MFEKIYTCFNQPINQSFELVSSAFYQELQQIKKSASFKNNDERSLALLKYLAFTITWPSRQYQTGYWSTLKILLDTELSKYDTLEFITRNEGSYTDISLIDDKIAISTRLKTLYRLYEFHLKSQLKRHNHKTYWNEATLEALFSNLQELTNLVDRPTTPRATLQQLATDFSRSWTIRYSHSKTEYNLLNAETNGFNAITPASGAQIVTTISLDNRLKLTLEQCIPQCDQEYSIHTPAYTLLTLFIETLDLALGDKKQRFSVRLDQGQPNRARIFCELHYYSLKEIKSNVTIVAESKEKSLFSIIYKITLTSNEDDGVEATLNFFYRDNTADRRFERTIQSLETKQPIAAQEPQPSTDHVLHYQLQSHKQLLWVYMNPCYEPGAPPETSGNQTKAL